MATSHNAWGILNAQATGEALPELIVVHRSEQRCDDDSNDDSDDNGRSSRDTWRLGYALNFLARSHFHTRLHIDVTRIGDCIACSIAFNVDGRFWSSEIPQGILPAALLPGSVDSDRVRPGNSCVRELLGFSAALTGIDFSNFRNRHIEGVERNGHHAVETDKI